MPPTLNPESTTPVLFRRAHGRIIGGVAGGLADHLGVDEQKVRIAFVLLSAAAGLGVVLYGLLWVVTRPGGEDRDISPTERRRAMGLATIGGAFAIMVGMLASGPVGSVLVPILVAIAGAGLVWREFDTTAPRALLGVQHKPGVLTWVRVLAGVALVILGLAVIWVGQVDFGALRSSLMAVVVTLIGATLLTVPIWLRLWQALNEERAARIRTEERDEIASHLHDSVLQTLALIQKQAGNAPEVQRLARSQERELRRWLFNSESEVHASLAAALKHISGQVEDHYGITIETVTVGDAVSTESPAYGALLGAVREALINAAKHSGESNIDVYSEVEPDQVSVFVRDRGVGFDAEQVPSDRQGLTKSIRQRIERRGGTVDVRTKVGKGTEVRIFVPRDDGANVEGAE
ncbi:ATP-binding protein [Hoyosella rhizosphaerae]|uniref:Two-component system sensor kinase n=1 Tax=Hoyosella rhizosphaerae TaxID=1755582 RepID=A0A916UAM6_9ACTN|nr:ATP-binding protein [Hoyosella rhizosphaerae]GGC65227.1 putative two-component system sensor kinase [Hoyosella rhizosphaerae]